MALGNITSRQAETVASETRELVNDRDVTTLAVTALSAAGGVIVAQTITDTVMGALDMNADPTNLKEYGVSVTVKALTAVAFGFAATSLGGLGLVAAGFMAIGSLASAGADLIEGLLTQAPLGGTPLASGTHYGSNKMMANATSGGSARVVSATSNGSTSSSDENIEFRETADDEVTFR
jgi:hypothetical protein